MYLQVNKLELHTSVKQKCLTYFNYINLIVHVNTLLQQLRESVYNIAYTSSES